MSDCGLVEFELSADFVMAHAIPTSAEIGYGFENGWLPESDVVGMAERELGMGITLPSIIEELALLLPGDSRMPEILSGIDPQMAGAARLWLYLALAWLRDNSEQFEDPYEAIESIYADFDYPDEIAGLVRFMPVPEGEATGLDAIDLRWRAYLDERSREYGRRS